MDILRFALCFILSFTLLVPAAFAGVAARLGQHVDYSRIVFEWDKQTGYDIQKPTESSLVITFKSDGNITNIAQLTDEIISNVKVVSSSPLKVEITTPASAKTRDFTSENKVIVDVYGKRADITAAKNVPPPAADKKEEVTSKKPEPATHEDAHAKPAASSNPTEVKQVAAQPVTEEKHETPVLEKIREDNPATFLMTLSSTDAMGLAAFRLGDNLWVINDRQELLINPQLSGPDPKSLPILDKEKIEGGVSYKIPLKSNIGVRAEGGGLLWRVIFSGGQDKRTPVRPVREDTLSGAAIAEGKARQGKIVLPFSGAKNILKIPHPFKGRDITVVTVDNADSFTGDAYSFVDFTILPSPLGAAIVPKVDDLEVKKTKEGVEISRASGLAVMSDEKLKSYSPPLANADSEPSEVLTARVFNFQGWKLGTLEAMDENKNIILDSIAAGDELKKSEGLLTIAKMYLAQGMWAESMGYLTLTESFLPDLAKTAEFKALRGAADALGLRTEEAFTELSIDDLKNYEEINYWRAFALADLGDWQQAERILPSDFTTLSTYPPELGTRLALVLAEVALRSGDQEKAAALLKILEQNKEEFKPEHDAAYEYLEGEAARQAGDVEKTKKFWEPLVTGADNLYRAKAGLALSRLLVDKEKLSPKETIDTLERLRYAWRGDELETQISYWLGKTYLESGDYAKGLNSLREAASVPNASFLRDRITKDMSQAYADLFLGPELEKMQPVDAAALYEQFIELSPSDDVGNKMTERLADHLVKGGLLTRAETLLQNLVDYRLTGTEIHRTGVKLAAVYLLDKKPDQAKPVLDKAIKSFQEASENYQTDDRKREISLLMARTMSQQGRTNDAIAFLENIAAHPDVNRLRADIAWRATLWDDAAAALADVIIDQNISLTRPLSKEHAELILQRALALNLAGDRVGLANMREKYGDAMIATDRAKIFDVVTRPRQSSALADRETLMGIVNEVDLFSDFLNSYKAGQEPSN